MELDAAKNQLSKNLMLSESSRAETEEKLKQTLREREAYSDQLAQTQRKMDTISEDLDKVDNLY